MRRPSVLIVVLAMSWAACGAESVNEVLVLPFAPAGQAGQFEWIGPAVQENMLSELNRERRWQGTPTTQPASTDVGTMQSLGRSLGASFVVWGSYQLSESNLRFTGQVLEVETGKLIGGLKASGPMRDLFALEDELAEQLRRILRKRTGTAAPAVAAAPAPEATSAPPLPESSSLPWNRDADWLQSAPQLPYNEPYYRWQYMYTPGPVYSPWYYPRPLYWPYVQYRSVPTWGITGWFFGPGTIYVRPRQDSKPDSGKK